MLFLGKNYLVSNIEKCKELFEEYECYCYCKENLRKPPLGRHFPQMTNSWSGPHKTLVLCCTSRGGFQEEVVVRGGYTVLQKSYDISIF